MSIHRIRPVAGLEKEISYYNGINQISGFPMTGALKEKVTSSTFNLVKGEIDY